ncbi:J domain-containing protein [Nodosilinea sp. AN01ver1]|uniref:J domain-containing protein n=1 Tax=Nodosilinea sp. AN01ver1 TaxID=3423362 RepID=UPI003D316FC7
MSPKKPSNRRKPANISQIRAQIRKLASLHNYDEQVLLGFAEFVHGGKFKEIEPSLSELKESVCQAFNCPDYKSLKKNKAFKLATAGRGFNFSYKDSWLTLYREWVRVPENERNEIGPNTINGIDVLKNFRPWQVFQLDPKTATTDDINTAFRQLAKKHHPDAGGDRKVFEELQKMRDSLLLLR